MKNYFLMGLMLLGWVSITHAQQESGLPLQISVFDENIALPSYRMIQTPIHPGVRVGTEVLRRENGSWQRGLQLGLSGYVHPYFHNALMIDGQYYIRYQFARKFGVSAGAGLGYHHSFFNMPRYDVTENGYEESGAGFGAPNLIASGTISAYVGLPGNSPTQPELVLAYQFGAQTFQSPAFPVLPHTFFHVGLRMYPFAK